MTSTITDNKINVRFKSQGVELAGILHVPEGFSEDGNYPAVLFSPPFNQVKEQTGAVYGRHLAEQGYVTLVFDHLGQALRRCPPHVLGVEVDGRKLWRKVRVWPGQVTEVEFRP